MLTSLWVILISIVPAIAFCVWVYKEDRYEKESVAFLVKLFLIGVACCLVSVLIKRLLSGGFDMLFSAKMTVRENGAVMFESNVWKYLYYAIRGFLIDAALEVGTVVLSLYVFTHKNKNFNALFDGIVYAVFLMMGASVFGNLQYGFRNGWDLLAFKTLATLPVQLFLGILMGYQYTMWNVYRHAARGEEKFSAQGLICVEKRFCFKGKMVKAFVLPWAIWGAYYFSFYMDMAIWRYVYYAIVAVMYVYGARKITLVSKNDDFEFNLVSALLKNKYKELSDEDLKQVEGVEGNVKEVAEDEIV